MILALDVGNTQVYGGVFEGDRMRLSFRRNSKQGSSSDEIGIFLRTVLRENEIDPGKITRIALCSVVPDVVYSLKGACRKYFDIEPFVLQAGVKTGLKIKYRNPLEVGADRIANAIAGAHLFPDRNLIIVDLGTATTFDAISVEREYLGGSIIAGLRLCMEALESKTAKLPTVEIVAATEALGRSTIESIQSGLYFGHIGQIRELSDRISRECFGKNRPLIIGTGGFAHLFEKEKIFDKVLPDLVLKGMLIAQQMNLENGGGHK
jgi:type III pantothenate kinase